jgi:hypothetical protein
MQDTIAIVFDFDDTLAPDTTTSFLESLGVDVKEFWTKTVQKRIDAGWDPVPAYFYEMIPEEVRDKDKKWSDYIDYCALDRDFQNDTFMQSWGAFRTRQERKLAPTSDPHACDNPGENRILVKVIDIFGNDASQALDVKVSLS